jgi:6,7-dimethyl-8-ribityllumazine synthase
MKEWSGNLTAQGMKTAIVVSRFNSFFTRQLLAGAVDCLVRHGAPEADITVAWVPGANEIPLAAQRMARLGQFDAVIALGAVIEGATPHADLINTQVARSLAALALASDLPVINGVVCARNIEQAIERSGTKAGNKGADAAETAIEMVGLTRLMEKESK